MIPPLAQLYEISNLHCVHVADWNVRMLVVMEDLAGSPLQANPPLYHPHLLTAVVVH